MIRLVFGILVVAGLVSGCDTDEPNPAEVLSLDRNRGEAPEGVSIQDVDIIKDGVIDIEDLFAVVHFYEQEVPESVAQDEDEAATPIQPEDDSLPLICQDIKAGIIYPNLSETVTDNVNLKKVFDAPDGGRYIYALLALVRKHRYLPEDPEPVEYNYPWCAAVRFHLDDNLWPTEVKIKPVAWFHRHKYAFSEPVTISFPFYHERSSWAETNERCLGEKEILCNVPSEAGSYIFVNSGVPTSQTKLDFWLEVAKSKMRMCIPITDDKVICKLNIITQEGKQTRVSHFEFIEATGIQGGIKHAMAFSQARHNRNNHGAYINISPTEVRQRYFPEDL